MEREKYRCTKKSKGVKFDVIKKKLTFTDYVNCSKTYKVMSDNSLSCTLHTMYTLLNIAK